MLIRYTTSLYTATQDMREQILANLPLYVPLDSLTQILGSTPSYVEQGGGHY